MTNKGILYALLWQQLPILMACLLVMGSGLPATGADAQMKLASETLIEIAGGTGSQAWRIRIGTQDSYKKQFVSAGDNRAWFSHGGWLRLFDTEGGMAIGRWHFPGEIVGLVSAENRVQVEVEDKLNDQIFHRTVSFDPEAGAAVLYWPTGSLLLNRVPFTEVESAWRAPGKAILLSERWEAPAEQDVKELIPELEEAVRRDPTAPLLRLALWRLLHTVGDARAPAVLEKALRITTTDFTETLLIAGLLEQLGEREPARAAFELGYRNFLDRGNDPRLVMALIGKMILYRPWVAKLPDLSTGHGRELMERNYRLAPRCEAADFAWQIYADFLEKNGQTEEAVKWRARAKEAAPTSVFLMPRSATLLFDWTILLVMASMIAAGLYVILLWIRYRPQRRADSAAREDQGRLGRAFSSLSFQYWSRSQRIVLLSVMIVAWIATGFVAGIMRGISRAAELPISFGMGSLAGPATVWFLENRLPPTPERDLLRATAYHQRRNRPSRKLSSSTPDWPKPRSIWVGRHRESGLNSMQGISPAAPCSPRREPTAWLPPSLVVLWEKHSCGPWQDRSWVRARGKRLALWASWDRTLL
jgi:tetratricopeptide (TPR) repeat protein